MNRVCPISGRGAATAEGGVCNGDIASAAEIAALNAVGRYTSTFYLLENMQGDILQGNPDPDQKTPDKVTEAGGNPSLCTYLEIAGVYSDRSGHLTGEPFTARLFLGKDATSNFDISRNCRYSVSLAMSDQGCLRSDWKVESNLEDTRVLIFQSSQLSLQTKDAVSVGLDTNLSLSDGDFSYSISGKTGKFTVVTGQSGVTVTPNDAVSVGDAITVTVRTWDGAISSQCKITYIGPPDITWTLDWDEALYVGQRGHIKIKDKQGRNLEGKVFLFDSNNPQMDVSGSGADWYVDAYGPTTQLLGVYFLGNEVGFIPTEIVNPRMGFCSSDIVLPLDGAPVEIGPFYYRRDGSRLYYEDFAPDLYQSLLGFTVTRSCKTIGSKWSKDADKLNPAVGWSNVGNGYVSWEMHLKTLSSNGYLIQQNYSFGSGQVQLEEVTAKIDRANSGIVSCSAKVYTVDPFASSSSFGTADSWTLASWLQLDDHDEVLEYGTESLVADGTDLQYTGLVASPDISPCIPALDAETGITVTLPYSAYATGAMPPSNFTLTPTVTNRWSGDTFVSSNSYSAMARVNLAVGGVARDSGSGGCTVSVEWAFPRPASGVIADLENIVAGKVTPYVRGLYTDLYTVGSTSAEAYMSTYYPSYAFIAPNAALSASNFQSGDYYVIPYNYSGGYSLRVWKYEKRYSSSRGWLSR